MAPIFLGLVIGALVAGIPLATVLTIYLRQQTKQSTVTSLNDEAIESVRVRVKKSPSATDSFFSLTES